MRFLPDNNVFPRLDFRRIELFSGEYMALPLFDIVIFTGVLYHVHDMLYALKRVRAKTRELVIIETHINESMGNEVPCAIYYENGEFNDDPTNWWGPNTLCLEAMFRTAGFQHGERIWTETAGPANSRTAYHLRPDQNAPQSQFFGSAEGNASTLEEYRQKIIRQGARIAELEGEIDKATVESSFHEAFGSPGQIRTADQRINSPSLYH